MELWNNGTLTVDRDMDMELIEAIEAIFGEDYKIYLDEREITFDDSEGYILDYLNDLAELLEKYGLHITDGDYVFSYGDRDCYYVWNDGAFETMDLEDYAVYSLSDEELRNILTSCEWYIGESSRMPIVRTKPRGTIRRCPLMKDRKCAVHRAKPAVCAMYPLGRSIMIGKNEFSPEAVKNDETQYILNDIHCGNDSETHTVRSYLEAFGIPVEDWFFHEWQSMVCELGIFIHKAEKKLSEKAMNQLWMTIFLVMYLSYDTNSGFEPQFMENKTKLLELIHMLPIAA